uniref:Uncharacterized protein n=1 Tax=Cannabis sativa TaxID=3483 RepID=A0A803PJ83_CANSA
MNSTTSSSQVSLPLSLFSTMNPNPCMANGNRKTSYFSLGYDCQCQREFLPLLRTSPLLSRYGEPWSINSQASLVRIFSSLRARFQYQKSNNPTIKEVQALLLFHYSRLDHHIAMDDITVKMQANLIYGNSRNTAYRPPQGSNNSRRGYSSV